MEGVSPVVSQHQLYPTPGIPRPTTSPYAQGSLECPYILLLTGQEVTPVTSGTQQQITLGCGLQLRYSDSRR
jgi:hypothetical protein